MAALLRSGQPATANLRPMALNEQDEPLELLALPADSELQVVLRSLTHTAYYSPASHSLSLRPHMRPSLAPSGGALMRPAYPSLPPADPGLVAGPYHGYDLNLDSVEDRSQRVCPTCHRLWPFAPEFGAEEPAEPTPAATSFQSPFTAPNYFRLLEARPRVDSSLPPPSEPETWENLDDGGRISSLDDDGHSVPGTPAPASPLRKGSVPTIDASSTAPGYYRRFFTQIKKLGRGARGQVYLCQHVLNGNKLGVYAVKKMPCGDDQQVLLDSLKEVLLMETLQHPNIIHYQHAWIEKAQASKFAPAVPTLFILMAAANGGSLEDWINTRSGRPADSGLSSPAASGLATRAERLKAAFRLQRRAHAPPPMGRAVHLLREDEVMSLARDIVSGLGFLHSKGILHLDVKPANCLLHWSEDALTPSVLLSDFGSSALLHDNWRRQRSGHTGTMEFMAPEAVRVNARTGMLDELSAKADIWSFGMILHLLIFLRLPYSQVDDVDGLREEMLAYGGWQDEAADMLSNIHTCQSFIPLLAKLLQIDPNARPSAEDILDELRHLAQERGMGLTEFDEPFPDTAREQAREERLRRRRKQSLSGGPRLLADTETATEGPLWMATDLAEEHPLVRYQQERMGLIPPPAKRPPPAPRNAPLLLLLLALAQKVGGDMYCFPQRMGRGWDYTLLLGSALACWAMTQQDRWPCTTSSLLLLALFPLALAVGYALGFGYGAGADVCAR